MKEFSFEDLSEETKRKIQQLQIYEQNYQQLLIEKRALTIEKEEIENAMVEIEKTKNDVFKIIAGQFILKTEKDSLIEEIKNKKEIISLRIKNIEKQEKDYTEKTENIRKEIIEEINNIKI
ncbi:MAG: prefoldin subunit [Candidatus Pacearchaeota archaeon]